MQKSCLVFVGVSFDKQTSGYGTLSFQRYIPLAKYTNLMCQFLKLNPQPWACPWFPKCALTPLPLLLTNNKPRNDAAVPPQYRRSTAVPQYRRSTAPSGPETDDRSTLFQKLLFRIQNISYRAPGYHRQLLRFPCFPLSVGMEVG